MKLSVIIVNYNVKYYLDQCIRSVLRAFEEMNTPAEIIVVDNHSADGSVDYLEQRYPQKLFPMVRFVRSAHNLGFARANNIAIRQSRGEYVLLLNPDTIVGEDALKASVDFMDVHEDAGAVGVRMLGAQGRRAMESRRGLPTPMVSFFKMLGFCNRWPHHRLFGKYYMGYLPWDEPSQIEVVSGAYCMLRRKALDEVGLLDEDFFMYGEDIDLSYRVLKGGYHNYYLPVDILHYKGESTQKSSFRYVHVFYEAMLIFFRKHYSGMTFMLSLPIKTAIYAKALMALVGMLSDRMRKSLGFFAPSAEGAQHYVFVGSLEMQDACRDIARRLGLDAEFHDSEVLEDKSEATWSEKNDNVLVLDADSMSYADMLKRMSRLSDMNVNVTLGTYSKEIGKIITDREILG
ncbi:glycosyltransferase family 2 protein [Prevotella copri]|uniref:glycosyltransferase family 2 protein n=1 Tax=Segatella copri TaxID=165179 RepID=UPI001C390ADE|nr:glycosyltransferase family 2 protein [Segatella copri]MBV3430829.1 glycosyltransferase family 2 protein [Segatella copri]